METKTKISVFSGVSAVLTLFLFTVFAPTVVAPVTAHTRTEAQPKVLGAEISTPTTTQVVTSLEPQQFTVTEILDTSDVIARSFFVYDTETGQILAEKEAHTKVAIASLTKLMTTLLAHEYFANDDMVTVAGKDILTTAPVLRLRVGDQLRMEDVTKAVLVGSANDAAGFLGRVIGEKAGVPIADLMNQKAGALGMQDSQFQNPIGFDSYRNFSTASDVHILVDAILRQQNFDDIGHLSSYSFTSTLGNQYRIKATNKLVQKDPSLTAIKTGYTNGAQGAMVTTFALEGHDIAIIVLGSEDREGDTVKLKQTIQQSYTLGSIDAIK